VFASDRYLVGAESKRELRCIGVSTEIVLDDNAAVSSKLRREPFRVGFRIKNESRGWVVEIVNTQGVNGGYGMLFPVTERRSFPVHTASSDCTGCHIDEQLADLTISNHLANKALTTHMEHETVGACCWLIPVDT
ncbi:MAG: hypothetical protein Q3X58_00175, partial [Collinsella sp.]|nr:hypothetical protein [Collinsella sp.]